MNDHIIDDEMLKILIASVEVFRQYRDEILASDASGEEYDFFEPLGDSIERTQALLTTLADEIGETVH